MGIDCPHTNVISEMFFVLSSLQVNVLKLLFTATDPCCREFR